MAVFFFNRIASCTAVTRNLRKVLPDDYDKETLWAAVQEGRVYIGIFACDELFGLLTPSPKARKFKAFNKYNVMRIIGVLREAGVYGQYNDLYFIHLLEHTDQDNSYRSYLGKGIEQHPLLLKLLFISSSV